ncbi:MAG: DUF1992 domain-containing protein [Deltaproteobacteria bacterium]|nr:MAG: DUF1992 domain-containing protein [Deltaproteobacteria bacterium]
MISGFEKIVEERIKNAQQKGVFDNLSGAGRPLELEEDRHVPEELRLAHKILKNADCIPPEIELKRQIRQTRDLLSTMKDTAEKYHVLKKLNFLIMKMNSQRQTNIMFEVPQQYRESLVKRFDAAPPECGGR